MNRKNLARTGAGTLLLAALLMPARAEIMVSRPDQENKSDPAWVHQQASDLFQKGIALINEGKFDQGLEDVRQATQLEPELADWHINYGGLLFARAGLLYKSHKEDESVLIAKEADTELDRAVELVKGDQAAVQKSHCYYLKGHLAYFIYKDKQAAKQLYQQALTAYPDNPEAKEALKTCE